MIGEALLKKVKDKFGSFELPMVDPWRRVEGVLLELTPSEYGLRQDGVGRLMQISPSDFIVGRDSLRFIRLCKREAKNQSHVLSRNMIVNRSHVIGKARVLKTGIVSRNDCRVTVLVKGQLRLPPLFVCYRTPAGNMRFRVVKGVIEK